MAGLFWYLCTETINVVIPLFIIGFILDWFYDFVKR